LIIIANKSHPDRFVILNTLSESFKSLEIFASYRWTKLSNSTYLTFFINIEMLIISLGHTVLHTV